MEEEENNDDLSAVFKTVRCPKTGLSILDPAVERRQELLDSKIEEEEINERETECFQGLQIILWPG